MATSAQQYAEYLNIIANPDKMQKVAKLDFLNPDGTIAFTIDNNQNRSMVGFRHSKAFLQQGTLNVSLNNGQRRKASVTFANLDREFDFNVNKLWFGQQIRLSMGVKLSDGSNFYLPQGVFYIDNPQSEWKPNSRTITYQLVDKWSYLDGSLFGKLRDTYEVPKIDPDTGQNTNIFNAMQAILQLNKYTLEKLTDVSQIQKMIDNVTPIFTDYYNDKYSTIRDEEGNVIDTLAMKFVPYDIRVEAGQSYASVLLELNRLIAGWIGYDSTGALRVDPSPDFGDDTTIGNFQKPIIFEYSPSGKQFGGLTETSLMREVFNELLVVGEAIQDGYNAPYAIAVNEDANSDTNIYRIGRKTQTESDSGYYTAQQCAALAKFRLRRMGALQKQITLTSTQMFHLQENTLITVKRTDKDGSPIEKHLIQSYSIPIAEQGTMSITATSVLDYPDIRISDSSDSTLVNTTP